MKRRHKISAALALLGAVLAASVGSYLTIAAPAAGPKCGGYPSANPNITVMRFLLHAVKREQPALSWNLVAPKFRGDTTCEEWAAGTSPIVPLIDLDPSRVQLVSPPTVKSGVIMLHIALLSASQGWVVFWLELSQARDGGPWLVSYFAPDVQFAVRAPAA